MNERRKKIRREDDCRGCSTRAKTNIVMALLVLLIGTVFVFGQNASVASSANREHLGKNDQRLNVLERLADTMHQVVAENRKEREEIRRYNEKRFDELNEKTSRIDMNLQALFAGLGHTPPYQITGR